MLILLHCPNLRQRRIQRPFILFRRLESEFLLGGIRDVEPDCAPGEDSYADAEASARAEVREGSP